MSLASNLRPLPASGQASNTTLSLPTAAAHPEGKEPKIEDVRQNPRHLRVASSQARMGAEELLGTAHETMEQKPNKHQ